MPHCGHAEGVDVFTTFSVVLGEAGLGYLAALRGAGTNGRGGRTHAISPV